MIVELTAGSIMAVQLIVHQTITFNPELVSVTMNLTSMMVGHYYMLP